MTGTAMSKGQNADRRCAGRFAAPDYRQIDPPYRQNATKQVSWKKDIAPSQSFAQTSAGVPRTGNAAAETWAAFHPLWPAKSKMVQPASTEYPQSVPPLHPPPPPFSWDLGSSSGRLIQSESRHRSVGTRWSAEAGIKANGIFSQNVVRDAMLAFCSHQFAGMSCGNPPVPPTIALHLQLWPRLELGGRYKEGAPRKSCCRPSSILSGFAFPYAATLHFDRCGK
jgi:hypothetical protein